MGHVNERAASSGCSEMDLGPVDANVIRLLPF